MLALYKYVKEISLSMALFLIPFFIPIFTLNEVGTLVTATSTVFAVVAGFFIADAISNYLRLQSLIAEENSALIAIAQYAKITDKKNYLKVHRAVDAYMIAQLDAGTLDHFHLTHEHLEALVSSVHSLVITPVNSLIYDHLLAMIEKILTSRQETTLAAKKTLTTRHWFTLIGLAGLVIITILAIRDGTLFMNFFIGLVNVTMLSILLVLRDIDNNGLLEKKLAYKNPHEVFMAISKPPYYPSFSKPSSRIPINGRMRVGK